MALQIRYSPKSLRQLRKLDPRIAITIRKAISKYAAQPDLSKQVKRMKGKDEYRLRVGKYRVIFGLDGIVLSVLRIGHRKDVYR
jgi:mRNA interferase RelE/StbE